MVNAQPPSRGSIQLIWGIALMLAGFGVFYRIPQVMPRLAQIEGFANVMGFIQFCFYLMGIILVGGGAQKVVRHFQAARSDASKHEGDPDSNQSRDDAGRK